MSILFSPIGTADPMTQLGDGPMLHIVRHYNPDKVVLFFSPKMGKIEQEFHRYTKAIHALTDDLGFDCPEIETIYSEYSLVHRFDEYIKIFEPILVELTSNSDKVLVNVSSGTPGMQQALVAIGSLGRIKFDMLQVSTPKNDSNKKDDREDPNDYDFEALWKNCKKVETNGSKRITVVETPNFAKRILCEKAVVLLDDFEYDSAYKLVEKVSSIEESTKELIKGAEARLTLNQEGAAQVFSQKNLKCKDLSYKSQALILEYLYVMEVRLQQGHYAEFMRSITPALTRLMQYALRPTLPEEEYLLKRKGKLTDNYNVDLIKQNAELDKVLGSSYYKNKNFIQNSDYIKLIKHYCKDNVIKDKINVIRKAEIESRNSIAHNLTKTSRESIEKKSGIKLNEIMQLLFELYDQTKPEELATVPSEPGLYKRINKLIVSQL